MVELFEGQIRIDEVDFSKFGLQDLSSPLAIVSQDVVLFERKIRMNTDFVNLDSDVEI